MTKYRKLPVVIEARHHANGVVGMVEDLAKWCGGRVVYDSPVAIIIPTLEGEMRAEFGDWIIRGVKGEFYPIKDEIFRARLTRWSKPTPCLIWRGELSPTLDGMAMTRRKGGRRRLSHGGIAITHIWEVRG